MPGFQTLADVYTVLQAPVACFEDLVRPRWERWAPDYCRDEPGVLSHVSLLVPFLPARRLTDRTLSALAETVGAHAEFDVEFSRLGRFPDGLVHALPEPVEPWTRLAASLADRFPAVAAEAMTSPPHLSLDYAPRAEDLAPEARLPRRDWVRVVELVSYRPRGCEVLASFPLSAPTPSGTASRARSTALGPNRRMAASAARSASRHPNSGASNDGC